MRWVRGSALVLLVLLGASALARALRRPLLEGWQVLGSGTGHSAAADFAVLVESACALLLTVSCTWLVLAVAACTWDALVGGTSSSPASTVLRPRVLRACVAACLGASVLGPSAAQARSAACPGGEHPGQLTAVAAGAAPEGADAAGAANPIPVAARLLEGLPVPDRATGPMVRRSPSTTPRDATSDARSPIGLRPAEGLTLPVRPGDNLWTLTADLLPADAPVDVVTAGWHLLYAANRAVIGEDPDLLHPGQSLQVSRALLELAGTPSRAADRRSS